jgi:hypothetical protein
VKCFWSNANTLNCPFLLLSLLLLDLSFRGFAILIFHGNLISESIFQIPIFYNGLHFHAYTYVVRSPSASSLSPPPPSSPWWSVKYILRLYFLFHPFKLPYHLTALFSRFFITDEVVAISSFYSLFPIRFLISTSRQLLK